MSRALKIYVIIAQSYLYGDLLVEASGKDQQPAEGCNKCRSQMS